MESDLIKISLEPIDVATLYQALSDPECGAQLIFLGVVRNENEGRRVKSLSYEAFAPMAVDVFREMAREARELVGSPLRVAIIHRVGKLEIGEVSTAIGVATPHRAESYRASRYLIEQLKARVPIWKEELYSDGEKKWLDGKELVP